MQFRWNSGDASSIGERTRSLFTLTSNESFRKAGAFLYGALIVAVALLGLWLSATLSNVRTFGEVRPALQSALAALSGFLGGPGQAVATTTPASTITASGAVASLDEMPVLSPASTKVASVHVKVGQMVTTGQLLVKMSDADVQKEIRNAEAALASAKAELSQLDTPANPAPVAPNTQGSAQAEADISKAIQSGYVAVSDTFVNATWIMGVEDILYGTDVSQAGVQQNLYAYADLVKQPFPDVVRYRDAAARDFETARGAYESAKKAFEGVTPNSPHATIESNMQSTQAMLKALAQSLKSTSDFLAFVDARLKDQQRDAPSQLAEHLSGVADRTRTVNDNLEAILNAESALSDARAALSDAQNPTAGESQAPSANDRAAAALAVSQREKELAAVKAQLSQLNVMAPVSGRIQSLDAVVGKSFLLGEYVATIAAPQNVARIAVTESEVIKLRPGLPALVSFDAVPGFEQPGKIIQIDSDATIRDGNVTFNVYIAFDAEDPRIRRGMSVTGTIRLP